MFLLLLLFFTFSSEPNNGTKRYKWSSIVQSAFMIEVRNIRVPFLLKSNSPQDQFQVKFHIPENNFSFYDTYQYISDQLHGLRRSPIGSKLIYHFVLWPKHCHIVTNDDFCIRLLSNNFAEKVPYRTNLFFLLPNFSLFEIFSIKGQPFCQLVRTPYFPDLLFRLHRRYNFNQVTVVGTAATSSLTHSMAYSIFQDIAFSLNFTPVLIAGDWIMANKQGLPSGLSVQQLQNGTADIHITQTTVAAYRSIGFRYLFSTFEDGLFAFLQQPAASSVHDVHISPFKTQLWITIFITWVILAASGYISKIATRSKIRQRDWWEKAQKIHECVLWAVSSGCSKGWYKFPKTTPSRIICFCGAFCGLIISLMYSGAIVSSFTLQTLPIESFADLLKSNLDIYVDNTSSTIARIVDYLEKENSRPRGLTFLRADNNESVAEVNRRPAAVFGFERNFYRTAAVLNLEPKRICSTVTRFPILNLSLQTGMIVVDWSPLKEPFNHGIMLLKEHGILKRYLRHFTWESTYSCTEQKDTFRTYLGLNDVFTPFAIWFGGVVLACVVIVIERCKL